MDHATALRCLEHAERYAQQHSRDPAAKNAALVLSPTDGRILVAGVSGFPQGLRESEFRWQRPQRQDYCEHPERAAIYEAARKGVKLHGCWWVVTEYPCAECARGMLATGMLGLITPVPSADPRYGQTQNVAASQFAEAGVEVWMSQPSIDRAAVI